jgi:hypothetical protein
MGVAGFLIHLTTEIKEGRMQIAEYEAFPVKQEMHSKFCSGNFVLKNHYKTEN